MTQISGDGLIWRNVRCCASVVVEVQGTAVFRVPCLHSAAESFLIDSHFNLLKPTGYVLHQQFDIQQLYALPTLYLCVLYLSENKQRLVPLTA